MLYLLHCFFRHRVYVDLGQLLATPLYHLPLYLVADLLLFQPLDGSVLLDLSNLRLLLAILVCIFGRIVHLL